MAGVWTATGLTIGRATGRCAATGRAFAPGERYVATLAERDGAPGLERADFSLDAWEQGRRPEAPLVMVGSWKSVAGEARAKRHAIADDEELLDLFSQLEGTTEPRRVALRYVLALLLVRRRLLVHEGVTPASGSRPALMRVRLRRAGSTPTEVIDPGMDEALLTEAVATLTEALSGGGGGSNSGGAATPTGSAPASGAGAATGA